MSNFIREESNMRLVKKQGYNLFDIEKFIRENGIESKTPEIILWNEKNVLILEAKQSVPREPKEDVPAELGKQVKNCGYKIVSNLDYNCNKLWEKYTSALIFLRPDVINHFLDKIKSDSKCAIEKQQALRRIKLNKVNKICLLFILKDIPSANIPPLQEILDEKIIIKIREWQPNCQIKVMNEEMAIEYGFVEPHS